MNFFTLMNISEELIHLEDIIPNWALKPTIISSDDDTAQNR